MGVVGINMCPNAQRLMFLFSYDLCYVFVETVTYAYFFFYF